MEEGFPGSAVLAFQYFLVRDKWNRGAQAPAAGSAPSPDQFNDKEDYKAPLAMWGVIQVKGNGNIKDACDALAWDMTGSGLQVQWKEHQLAESSVQVLLMNVPAVLERGGVENEILWHLSEIKKKLIKRGTLPLEYVGVPLPNIKVSWRQSKQGKGRSKAECDLSLNLLRQPYQQNGCHLHSRGGRKLLETPRPALGGLS